MFKVLREAKETVKETEFSKASRFFLFFDVFYCMKKFHVTGEEYLKYKFYNHKNRYRKDFITRYDFKYGIRRINVKGFTSSKYKFYQMLPECFSREIILAPECSEETFLSFARKHKRFVVKPDNGSCGRGISVFVYTDDEQARKYFSEIKGDVVCEEFIVQHEEMNRLNPFSVNTVRIVSVVDSGEIILASGTLRTGARFGKITDNLSDGGAGAQIDLKTGIITSTGFDFDDKRYMNHPVTGVQFVGFAIPNWDKVVALVKEAHLKCSQCKLLGWDIAVTPEGAVVLEANNSPDAFLTQLGDMLPKGKDIHRVINSGKKYRPSKDEK